MSEEVIQIAKPVKIETVAQITALLEKSSAVILTDYRGLTMAEVTELRKKLREHGGEVHVVKNTLFRRAAKGTAAEGLEPFTKGPSAATFGSGDPAALAKVLTDFAKDHKQVALKGGLVDGHIYDAAQVKALAKLPTRDVLLAQVMSAINGPATGVAGAMQSVMRKLMGTITAVAEKNAA